MGKRSSFERVPRDFYPTPREAVLPLLPHLAPGTRFTEPCAGDGALVRHLESAGHHCELAYDIEGESLGVWPDDARTSLWLEGDAFITNPPWDRKVLHPIILNLSRQAPLGCCLMLTGFTPGRARLMSVFCEKSSASGA